MFSIAATRYTGAKGDNCHREFSVSLGVDMAEGDRKIEVEVKEDFETTVILTMLTLKQARALREVLDAAIHASDEEP